MTLTAAAGMDLTPATRTVHGMADDLLSAARAEVSAWLGIDTTAAP